jgi:hypothetical protein
MLAFDVSLAPKQALCVRVEAEDVGNGVAGKIIPELCHVAVNGQPLLLSAIIVCKDRHYMSYFYARGLSWLGPDGWYFYDGMAGTFRVRSLGRLLRVDSSHARNIELLLYARV